MKHIVWTAVLVMMVVATGVSAREAAKADEDAPTVDQLERHERALELQAREAATRKLAALGPAAAPA